MAGITHPLLIALLLTWTSSARPQYPKLGYDGPLSTNGTVDSLRDGLQLGTSAQREALLVRLGVSEELAVEASQDAIVPGARVEPIEGTSAALLTLPNHSPSQYASLFLVRKQAGGSWRAVNSVTLDCWWHAATSRILFVPKHAGSLILAEHVGAGHGSGLAVDNMELYEVPGDKLVRVLLTEQEKSEVISGGPALRTENASTLLPLPDGSLEETRSVVVYRDNSDPSDGRAGHKELMSIRRRCWSWKASSRTYQPSAFVTVHH